MMHQLSVMLDKSPDEAAIRKAASDLVAQLPEGALVLTLPFPPGVPEYDAGYREGTKVRLIRAFDLINAQMLARLDVAYEN